MADNKTPPSKADRLERYAAAANDYLRIYRVVDKEGFERYTITDDLKSAARQNPHAHEIKFVGEAIDCREVSYDFGSYDLAHPSSPATEEPNG
jgi:hypothetical protein